MVIISLNVSCIFYLCNNDTSLPVLYTAMTKQTLPNLFPLTHTHTRTHTHTHTHTQNIHTHTQTHTNTQHTQKNSGLVGTDVDKSRVAVKKIQGMVVEMPLRFLEKENLEPDIGTVESFAPGKLVT